MIHCSDTAIAFLNAQPWKMDRRSGAVTASIHHNLGDLRNPVSEKPGFFKLGYH